MGDIEDKTSGCESSAAEIGGDMDGGCIIYVNPDQFKQLRDNPEALGWFAPPSCLDDE